MSNQIQVELQGFMGDDRILAESAWTSSLTEQSKASRSDADVERVVNMLADNRHSTPFESIVFRFWIKMPIATDRQFMTHRIQSSNGMSGRYRTMPCEFLEIPQDVRDVIMKAGYEGFIYKYNQLCKESNDFYIAAIKKMKEQKAASVISNDEYKRAREFFRGVLPQHNLTERTTTINLRSLANFIKLRNSEHAQPEIRKVAELMLQALKDSNVCPIAIQALERNKWMI